VCTVCVSYSVSPSFSTNTNLTIGTTFGGQVRLAHYNKSDYINSTEYLEKSLDIHKEIGVKEVELENTTYLYLSYKHFGRGYDEKEIHSLTKETESIEFEFNLRLYELLEDKFYLETAYNQVQEKADAIDKKLKEKFLNYPIPKQIIEEYNKVFS